MDWKTEAQKWKKESQRLRRNEKARERRAKQTRTKQTEINPRKVAREWESDGGRRFWTGRPKPRSERRNFRG